MKSEAKPALYLVGTPIGNLEDITLRALRVLKEVDLIACEDTRHTQKLLNHYQISSRTISYHQHNEITRSAELLRELQHGTGIALVTDAGMPGISDPGFRLVALAIENQIPVIPVPGPSAFVTALAASGLPCDCFRFGGFLPPKRSARRQVLEGLKSSLQTEIFYEAPHRLTSAIEDIVEVLGASRRIVIARELTKIHEEFLRGSAKDILGELVSRGEVKGELTILIGKDEGRPPVVPGHGATSLRARLQQIMAGGMDEKAALKKLAKERGISKSEAYRELQRTK